MSAPPSKSVREFLTRIAREVFACEPDQSWFGAVVDDGVQDLDGPFSDPREEPVRLLQRAFKKATAGQPLMRLPEGSPALHRSGLGAYCLDDRLRAGVAAEKRRIDFIMVNLRLHIRVTFRDLARIVYGQDGKESAMRMRFNRLVEGYYRDVIAGNGS